MDEIDKKLLNDFQRDIAFQSRPYLAMANDLGISEDEVLERLGRLKDDGHISRIGAIVKPGSVGASTLAALKVPDDRLGEVGNYINSLEEVNHNYLREHEYNMWFVLNATNEAVMQNVIKRIETETGLDVLFLPMLQDFHLDLGFGIKWH
ncbi:AsnC family transcriptional regulator [Terasakiella sp. A23]|uniref:Lrp/AsnC family transcriptional regulator n=1 Tax=Terasakiella sp. FCG-A23 TaxID=3080561 RepID=UPI002954F609|nr:AsnC family transcriptional regulator [Terasakiella sp. A23]MDV7341283.1 AsnC family transcriptional regulator [Terasakiella sp. A23]